MTPALYRATIEKAHGKTGMGRKAMHNLTDKKKQNYDIFLAGVFLAYLVFNGILLARHELWRDEANVWLMARQLSPIQLLKEIKYQGHPCLWYLFVMPFAKLGLPFRCMGILSLLIMAVTAGVFLWNAPFHPGVKAVCAFSPIFTYFYPDIARNYCLIALMLMLLAWCYPRRNERCIWYGSLLGLLVQSDTIALAPAGMISLMWLWENGIASWTQRSFEPVRKILRGIWIPLASFILWIAQFYQVSDSPQFQINSLEIGDFFREVRNYCFWILERLSGQSQNVCRGMLILFVLLLLAATVRIRNGEAFCVVAASFLFEAVFSVMVYQLHYWHFIALCFVLIWTLWVLYLQREAKHKGEKLSGGALALLQAALLVFAVFMTLRWSSPEEKSSLDNALHGLYSDGVHTAEFIGENISPDELIVSANVAMASPVLAYLPAEYRFYYAGSGQIASYADYGSDQSRQVTLEELLTWSRTNFPEKEEFYLLDSEGSCIIDREELKDFTVLYQTKQETARGEEYTIYRISNS